MMRVIKNRARQGGQEVHLEADFTKIQPRPPLPVGEYVFRIMCLPYILRLRDGQEVLILGLEAKVSEAIRSQFDVVISHRIPKDLFYGWQTEALRQVVEAFRVPFDELGVETEDFINREGRARVEHMLTDKGDLPHAYIAQFFRPPAVGMNQGNGSYG